MWSATVTASKLRGRVVAAYHVAPLLVRVVEIRPAWEALRRAVFPIFVGFDLDQS